MEAYPDDYVGHNLPLVVLSGLGTDLPVEEHSSSYDFMLETATHIKSPTDIPPIQGERADLLLREFINADGRRAAWNARARNAKGGSVCTRFKAIGREFVLPPHKAAPPELSDDLILSTHNSQTSSWILHSPLSPLSPSSPLYPDGVMSPAWIAKHQHHIPAVFVSFFNFKTSDPSKNDSHDKQLIDEISGIKSVLLEYKIRYVVVFLSDTTIIQSPEIEDRLASIRRANSLDPKSSMFFIPPNTSTNEFPTFVQTVLVTLQPLCVEYYRDLTKHARRKKGRGSVPPPTVPPTQGTSRTLSNQGWGMRYDFKLGVFAEFRQEMDAASRHYNIALDSVLGPDGIFETLPSWSPRWDETRMLGDVIAVRLIRCLLWNDQPTSAVQAWSMYRRRMQSLLDRRGKGTSNYGWAAWESRWACIMAEIVDRADLPVFIVREPRRDGGAPGARVNALFSPPEKAFPVGERLQPWQLLHHPGYWLRLAANHARRRRDLSEEMPEEDRVLPSQAAATKGADRYASYDLYLVPPPHIEQPLEGNDGYDHCSEISELLNQAISQYFARGQQRFVDRLNLELGWALLHGKRYSDALSVLKPLWEGMSWRTEGWWHLASAVTWALNESAFHCQEANVLVCTEWEILSKTLPSRSERTHDLMKCLDPILSAYHGIEKTRITLSSSTSVSPLHVNFAFSALEGHVGEPLLVQLVLTSHARNGSKPLLLSELFVSFKGCISEVRLTHSAASDSTGASTVQQIVLQEASAQPRQSYSHVSKWTGEADLSIHAGQVKAFNFPLVFRDAGDVTVTGTTLNIDAEQFVLSYSTTPKESHIPPAWWIKGARGVRPKQPSREVGIWTHILPKPPKMDINISNLQKQYYTDEPVTLDIELFNHEDEDTEAVIEVRLLGGAKEALEFTWLAQDTTTSQPSATPNAVDLPGHQVGRLSINERRTERIHLGAPTEPSAYAMEIKVLYHLLSDLSTPVSKILTVDLVFASPFEASYDFLPRVHPDPWPSYFDPSTARSPPDLPTTPEPATGIPQAWLLHARIASFATSPLLIISSSIIPKSIPPGTTLHTRSTSPSASTADPVPIAPHELTNRSFALTTRKQSLDERRPATLDLSLAITWRRPSSPADHAITTTLPIPAFALAGAEPRVLASAHPSPVPTATATSTTTSTSTSTFPNTASTSTSTTSTSTSPNTTTASTTSTSTSTKTQIIHLTYTLENPTAHFLTFELGMEASEEFAFAGPKVRRVGIVPLSRRRVVFALLPVLGNMGVGAGVGDGGDKGRWINPVLKVTDSYFHKTLKVVAAEGCRGEKKGVGVWVPE
ncbi:hypothetical protein EJ05DRAFT_507251 [Pseudovirgaria hyperparasitica]|uniref:Trafficking protein particle complex subunit 11 domain-containing protein n=1 Tax=Pseudovirgaria hyperparasitica TaxID=470096 RepID=A0A6A6WFK2_9PEZI|nr:uncharacterized protein EJ05DRAFT_507251 [Pseudovirgaria hyperparasitica]KAF2761598.1 hypothetical protein EJ05DRAFT_507251 [Pseudovirgaria hyperparasitica]